MWRDRRAYSAVLEEARKVRPIIQPNPGFAEQLVRFQEAGFSLDLTAAAAAGSSGGSGGQQPRGAGLPVSAAGDPAALCSELSAGLQRLEPRLQTLVAEY